MPLTRIRVVDLSRLLPGPYATQLLADLGADVIKVEESSRGGDPLRFFEPLAPDGNSVLFHALNRGKKSVALPLRTEAGVRELKLMLAEADVVVESFRPGVLEKMLGQSVDELLAEYPRLIVARLSGFGQASAIPGHDANFMASGGVLGMMKNPAILPIQVADLAGGAWPAALQICAALYSRDIPSVTGSGAPSSSRKIDVNLTHGAHATLCLPLARHAMSGAQVGAGVDELGGSAVAYSVYRGKDGEQLTVGAIEPHFWKRMCVALEVDPKSATRRDLEDAFATKSASDWERELLALDVPVTRVRSPEESAEHLEEDLATAATVQVQIGHRTLRLTRTPLSIGKACTAPGPLLGQHGGVEMDSRPPPAAAGKAPER